MNPESATRKDRYFGADRYFDSIYPYQVQKQSVRHWTPLHIARQVLDFLAVRGSKVLDIGSGTGKFCLTGAHLAPDVQFIGVEQRRNLVAYALKAQRKLNLPNASFINANFTQLNLRHYDHFYFYNSFYENVDEDERIDDSIEYSISLYEYYSRYLYRELRRMPIGTRIATYHSGGEEIPDCYRLIDVPGNGFLKFWMKL
jgi:SAM-dependent methyltransferase